MNNLPENLEKFTQQAVKSTGIKNLQEIYRGTYYSPAHLRNVIFSCEYQGKPAILKVYDDPRETAEPLSLKTFHQHNRSSILKAPQLYDFDQIDSQKGWLLMEKIPDRAVRFENQLDEDQRKEFLEIFLEYRLNFPTTSPVEPTLSEHLNSPNFHVYRINRWFELANKKDSDHLLKTGQHLTDPYNLVTKLQYSLNLIREVFLDRPLLWSHGHLKNHEVFKVSNTEYYLLDFAHTKSFPQGYELGFLIWADYMMSDNWKTLTPHAWQEGIQKWLEEAVKICQKLKYPQPRQLMLGSLLERSWGSILADVLAAEKPLEEKQTLLKLLFQLVDWLCTEI